MSLEYILETTKSMETWINESRGTTDKAIPGYTLHFYHDLNEAEVNSSTYVMNYRAQYNHVTANTWRK